ncbi:DUF6087 family protein [Streptomyces sp. H27-H1]|uniref:DUF6087 family protein n=1 Tax=unclassified Streptomyces TaxID=2593676 RepID=UPI00226E7CD2|nr:MULTISPECIES: DUF6087 family protein [unclassified Streptomyces]MCY0929513.1 DUF6087 family protein [Streptomyces sp. H27-H1]MCY0939656.1 DUF6087 family protein [Streptomyces sp. H34-S4]
MATHINEPADEPLHRWAARREHRLRPPGTRKALTLSAGPQRAGHVDPGVARLIVEWDGFQWVPVMLAEDYAAARRLLDPTAHAEAVELPGFSPAPLRAGRGRHRRT